MTSKDIKNDNCRAFIFDLDGTLSYTLDSIAISGNLALEAAGLKGFETEAYKYYCGDGADELVKRILRDSGDMDFSLFDVVKSEYLKAFAHYADYNVRPYEKMPETIGELKRRGYKLAVLSNKPHKQCIQVVEKLYGKGVFDFILGYTDTIERKPSPEGALLIAGKLNIRPEEFIYVGDTATDMQTGNSAGMNTAGVLWGYRDEKELKGAGAKYIIKTVPQLLELIL